MTQPSVMQRTVLQILPRRTSAPDGIGDYAAKIASVLAERHAIGSVFVCCSPAGEYPPADDFWPKTSVSARTGDALCRALDEAVALGSYDAVLLHVGGYGYAKRGVPRWLLDGMQTWRKRSKQAHIIGVFHELYAKGKPWNSSFWLGPLQKQVARRLWDIANCGLTTNSVYLRELAAWRPEAADRLALMPVISTVGEPGTVAPVNARSFKAVVFGSAGTEKMLYEEQAEILSMTVKALGITQIFDIGRRHSPPPRNIGGAEVHSLGALPAERISRELLDSRYGFLNYDIARLGKSTIFAAYASHGVLPVCFGSTAIPADGLIAGQHFLLPNPQGHDADGGNAMQRRLLSWYAEHATHALIDCLAAMCLPQWRNQGVAPSASTLQSPASVDRAKLSL